MKEQEQARGPGVSDLEHQLAEAQRILNLDDSRLMIAVKNTAKALGERDEAQGKLDKVRTWRQATRINQPTNWPILDRILKEEK